MALPLRLSMHSSPRVELGCYFRIPQPRLRVGLNLPVPGDVEIPLPIFRPFARNHRGSGLHFHASGTLAYASQWTITSNGLVGLPLERTKVFTYVQVQGEFLGDMMLFTWIA